MSLSWRIINLAILVVMLIYYLVNEKCLRFDVVLMYDWLSKYLWGDDELLMLFTFSLDEVCWGLFLILLELDGVTLLVLRLLWLDVWLLPNYGLLGNLPLLSKFFNGLGVALSTLLLILALGKLALVLL